ncbi:patatin-like phospholipase family protein [Bacillus suaedaesalsae]|uniref:Patatin-like phospholipase family protein n=1 Tax=Bacillus suaedaesalsae TaxID=2810349 RepID=A0ABS2DFT6_9BACI|nr:patatin-like phospholipase family protein [Bacillus suaedaesalsae]MBM6617320.1 patatin-like phospholipase family protein [Bacillus suaedaesalsae]
MKVDCVFSGGGIKGFALIGAIQALEKNGLTPVRLAGTSAGAIIAAFVAAGYSGKELEQIMDESNLIDFLDARKSIFPISIMKWLSLYRRLGLYRGKVLESWLEEKLQAKGVKVFGDLPNETLRIVASDLTNGRIMVFPDDLERYGYDPRTFPIAKAIRMSAGIPYFFEPVKLTKVKPQPVIVDGALLSNFPVWLFEQRKKENIRPLIGFQLSPSLENRPTHQINNAIGLFKALFDTMMDAHDMRYISRGIEKNIVFIPVDSELSRDFKITKELRDKMIVEGFNRTIHFLNRWNY